jgi:CRISPR-associated endonuclease Csy4
MDTYIDIKLLPDPEFDEQPLMNALFSKLHRAIGASAPGKLGVSFPAHGKRLGNHLRIHGALADITKLIEQTWLQGMKDYCQISEVCNVPANVKYRAVKRVQAKSAHNKRERSIRKGWLTPEEALERIPESQQKKLTQPYIQMKSLSNGNPMRVYIEHGPILDNHIDGEFNAYGLSNQATIPWF